MELFVKYDFDNEKVTAGPQSGMAGEAGWFRYVQETHEEIGPLDLTLDKYIVELDAVVRIPSGTTPAPTYSQLRAEAYPKIREQLDLLFHDITTGTLNADGGLYQALLAVKTEFPKD